LRRLSNRSPSRRAVRRVSVRKGKGSSGAKIVRLAPTIAVVAAKSVRVEVANAANAAIDPPAVALMVIVPAAIAARGVTVPAAGGHLRWRRKLSSKN
jgi:hypothetical protein